MNKLRIQDIKVGDTLGYVISHSYGDPRPVKVIKVTATQVTTIGLYNGATPVRWKHSWRGWKPLGSQKYNTNNLVSEAEMNEQIARSKARHEREEKARVLRELDWNKYDTMFLNRVLAEVDQIRNFYATAALEKYEETGEKF